MVRPGARLAVSTVVWGFLYPGLVIGCRESEDIGGNASTSPWILGYKLCVELAFGSRFVFGIISVCV